MSSARQPISPHQHMLERLMASMHLTITEHQVDVERGRPVLYDSELEAAATAALDLISGWDGLLAVLELSYPEDIFTGSSGDLGSLIVVLARAVARADGRIRELEARLKALTENADTPPETPEAR